MADFVMPSLGADMEAGTLLEWRVQPGDTVHRGDIVAVVDTEKSTIEVEVFADGVVEALLVEPGTEAPVGAPLARIRPVAAPAEAAVPTEAAAPVAEVVPPAAARAPARKRAARPRKAGAKPARPRKAGAKPARPRKAGAKPAHVRASPLARRRAAERGLDLAGVAGSGPGGAVVAADLDRGDLAPAPAEVEGEAEGAVAPDGEVPGPSRGRDDRQAAMRRAIGALMARSAREIPHYHLATTIDMSAALAWLAEANEQRSVRERLLPGALLLKATALAAREVPALNGFWDGSFQPSPAVHLGVAVSLRGGGLIAPAIHDADRLALDELMAALRDLVGRARAGRLRSSEMSDPTLTVTNLGDQGVDEVHGVIYPPQVALVGFGRVTERPWASGGMLGVRPTVRATLAADHRATDGMIGARLLNAIDRLLQHPEDL
ncbi:MAG TPA: dihydrolipoamide acetyltransferase family protein [Acidimicrobiales bacterium]